MTMLSHRANSIVALPQRIKSGEQTGVTDLKVGNYKGLGGEGDYFGFGTGFFGFRLNG